MKPEFTISDDVWRRVVQVVQEAMLTGLDCVDYFRQIRVEQSEENSSELVLTSGYKQMVREHHKKLLDEAEAIKQRSTK